MKKLDIDFVINNLRLGEPYSDEEVKNIVKGVVKEILPDLYDRWNDNSQNYGNKQRDIEKVLNELGI